MKQDITHQKHNFATQTLKLRFPNIKHENSCRRIREQFTKNYNEL